MNRSNGSYYKIEPNNLSAEFYILNADSYNKAFPEFCQPKEIGSFSSKKRVEKLKDKNVSGVRYLGLSI